MNPDQIAGNWAAWLAAAIFGVALLAIILRLVGRSARGQLRKVLTDHKRAMRALREARANEKKAGARIEHLVARKDKVKPRHLQEAREAAEDARALLKVADDQVQVTANHVRRIIHEEFPPKRQL